MPLLHVKHVQFHVKINDDSGSRARKDLATWKPCLEDGWYYLGPAANNGDSRGCPGVIVKPAGGTTPLVPITDWVKVWSDAGSGNPTDYALWRGLPAREHRTNYIAIGGFFTRYSHQRPTTEDARGMMAVHKDCVVAANPGKQIWSDAGTRARQDGAIWEISTDGHLLAIDIGAFVPVEGHTIPPRNLYSIDRNRIVPEGP
ncbi:hypothetical protein EDC04DRAFT_2626260 [Pisolithus marmoratus]|nr:hypothetical protein EDC04DRAFT_2626260 [Pisolithus marmoratus]